MALRDTAIKWVNSVDTELKLDVSLHTLVIVLGEPVCVVVTCLREKSRWDGMTRRFRMNGFCPVLCCPPHSVCVTAILTN